MQNALLRLFNAVQVEKKTRSKLVKNVLERTLKNGYFLDPAIKPTDELLDQIEKIVGISGEKANSAFHKSWAIVQNSPIETLVYQQIVHYMTTYGFENLGIYNQNTVYVPHEKLEIPEITKDIPVVVIKAMTKKEIKDKVISLTSSGIALSKDTINDLLEIIKESKYEASIIDKVNNRELKIALYDYFDIAPTDPMEYLRYLVYKVTGETLIIKNDALINKIKRADMADKGNLLDSLLKKAPVDLASIFLRFKPLFLAMKYISTNKTFFNKLRKEAKYLHKPLPEDVMNNVTNRLKNDNFYLNDFLESLEKASIFRKIRLAYALKYRVENPSSIVYKVRNGKGWASDFVWPEKYDDVTKTILEIVLKSIADSIKKNVADKTIYIPSGIRYALPATEKQFVGNFPCGTSVAVPSDMIVGVHWENQNNHRIDLDLSMIDVGGKIGWDAGYRNEDVLFSGDMTDAPLPNGASELFYFKNITSSKIIIVNYFNFDDDKIDAKIVVASEKIKKLFDYNHMIDINNMIASTNFSIDKKQNVIGLVAKVENESRFYFTNISVGNSITSRETDAVRHSREYLTNIAFNSLDFREILIAAGANVVEEKPDGDHIDLSPMALDKTTILNLIN